MPCSNSTLRSAFNVLFFLQVKVLYLSLTIQAQIFLYIDLFPALVQAMSDHSEVLTSFDHPYTFLLWNI